MYQLQVRHILAATKYSVVLGQPQQNVQADARSSLGWSIHSKLLFMMKFRLRIS